MNALAWLSVFVLVMLVAPWAAALVLLWQAHPGRERWARLDGPGRLLALAMATLPDHRGDWGVAMTAELDQLGNRAQRWWFALGGLRVALFLPRANRRRTLGTATAAIALAVGVQLVAGWALPEARVFTVTFVAVIGAVTTLVVARSGQLSLGRAGVAVTASVPVAVGGAIGMAVYFLNTHPSADRAAAPGHDAMLALVFSLLLGLVLAPPSVLVPRRLAASFGIGGGLALALLLVVSARFGDDGGGSMFIFMIFGPLIMAATCGTLAAAASRSFISGVQAAVWTVAIGAPTSLIVGIPAAISTYQAGHGLLIAGDDGPIATNLKDLTLYLVWTLLTGLPAGVIGAALGATLRQPHPATNRQAPRPGPTQHPAPR